MQDGALTIGLCVSSDRVDSSLKFEKSEKSDRIEAPEITELGKRVVSGKAQ